MKIEFIGHTIDHTTSLVSSGMSQKYMPAYTDGDTSCFTKRSDDNKCTGNCTNDQIKINGTPFNQCQSKCTNIDNKSRCDLSRDCFYDTANKVCKRLAVDGRDYCQQPYANENIMNCRKANNQFCYFDSSKPIGQQCTLKDDDNKFIAMDGLSVEDTCGYYYQFGEHKACQKYCEHAMRVGDNNQCIPCGEYYRTGVNQCFGTSDGSCTNKGGTVTTTYNKNLYSHLGNKNYHYYCGNEMYDPKNNRFFNSTTKISKCDAGYQLIPYQECDHEVGEACQRLTRREESVDPIKGSFNPLVPSKYCHQCPKGWYSPSGTECQQCLGKETTTSTAGPCDQTCDNYVDADGDCVSECPQGQKLNGDRCERCPKGEYLNGNECTSCGPQHISLPDGTGCRPCRGNQYADRETNKCMNCNASMFVGVDGASCISVGECTGDNGIDPVTGICRPCKDGEQLGEASRRIGHASTNEPLKYKECQKCPPGQYRNSGQTSCTTCTSGFVNIERTGCVQECGNGEYDNNGQCTTCPDGQVYDGTACVSCGPGYKVNQYKTECIPCGYREYSDKASNEFCKSCMYPLVVTPLRDGCVEKCASDGLEEDSGACQCKSGYFNSQTGLCAENCGNMYISLDGRSCVATCGGKSVINLDGTRCVERCAMGQEPVDGRCKGCAEGMISDGTACNKCPDPTSQVPNETKSGCTNCAYNQLVNAQFQCEMCPDKQYLDRNNRKCVPSCPAGQQQDDDNRVCVDTKCNLYGENGECVDKCPSGTQQAGNKCEQCKPGEISDGTTCRSCPHPDSEVPGPSRDACVSCGEAEYVTPAFECRECEPSTYMNPAERKCVEMCPDGQQPENNICRPCPAWHVSMNGKKCTPCDKQALQRPNNDKNGCEICPSGEFPGITGNCIKCGNNQYYDIQKAECFDECPPNHYHDRNKVCRDCPMMISEDGSECIETCPDGQTADTDNRCRNSSNMLIVVLPIVIVLLVIIIVVAVVVIVVKKRKNKVVPKKSEGGVIGSQIV